MNFKKTLQITTAMLLVVASSSVANAQWNPPSGPAPSGNVDAPVHTGLFDQVKKGGLISQKWFMAPYGLFKMLGAGALSSGLGGSSFITSGIMTTDLGNVRIGKLSNGAFLTKGVETLPDGTFRVKTADTAPSGKVLTALDNNGTVAWMPASGGTPPPGGATLPFGQLNNTFRHDGTQWVETDGLQNNGGSVQINAKSPNIYGNPGALHINLFNNTGSSGRDAISINVSDDNNKQGAPLSWQPANILSNARAGIGFWNSTTNQRADIFAGFFSGKGASLVSDTDNLLYIAKTGTNKLSPIKVNLYGNAGQDVMDVALASNKTPTFRVDGGEAHPNGRRSFQFWDVLANGRANVLANQVQLTGGNPGVNKVLTDTSGNGDAEWKDVGDLIPISSGIKSSDFYTREKVETGSREKLAYADCDPGDMIISGGGYCWGGGTTPSGYLKYSSPRFGNTQGWTAGCAQGQLPNTGPVKSVGIGVKAYAICLKVGGGTVVVQPPTVINVCPNLTSGGPYSEVPAGYTLVNGNCVALPDFKDTSGIGAQGQTCQQWLTGLNLPGFVDDASFVQYAQWFGTTRMPVLPENSNGKCAYTSASTPTSGSNPMNHGAGECIVGDYATSPNPLLRPVSSCAINDVSNTIYVMHKTQVRRN